MGSCTFFFFLYFSFWIVSITYSLIIYILWHFGSFNIWICVNFCNIWTCLADFNDYIMYYSFEDNQFFFYISLLCNNILFFFQNFIGSKSYIWLFNIFWHFKSFKHLNYFFEGNTSFSYIYLLCSHTHTHTYIYYL